MADSNPDAENPDAVPDAVTPDAVNPDAVPDAVTPGEGPEARNPVDVTDAVTPGEGPDAPAADAENALVAEDAPVAEVDVPDLDIPDAELPEPEIPEPAIAEPAIPEPAIPDSLLAAPVIPPPPAETRTTRAESRSTWTSQSDAPASVRPRVRARLAAAARSQEPAVVPERSLAPEDVVPPESSSGGYRGLTIVIFAILLALLVGAIVLIGVLLSGGISPFPSAASAVGASGLALAAALPV